MLPFFKKRKKKDLQPLESNAFIKSLFPGGTSQAIKALAFTIEEKRYRAREKALAGDNYGYIDVQPSSNYSLTPTQYPPAQCQCNVYQQLPAANRHRTTMAQTNGMCCVHDQQQMPQQPSRNTANLMYSNLAYPLQQQNYHQMGIPVETGGGGGHLPQMSHSRSLEHYSEPTNHHQHNMLPHRHSFDHQQQGCTGQHHLSHNHHHHHHLQQQQQNYYQHLNQPQQNFYESPYDCIDGNSLGGGSSNISYAAVAANAAGGGGINCNLNANATYSHPYNVSGNRIPLPFNISHQLSAYDNSLPPSAQHHQQQQQEQEPTYAHVTDHHMYAAVAKLPQNYMANSTTGIGGGAGGYNHMNHQTLQNSSKDLLQRQRSYQTEQLIDFEDPPILPPPPSSSSQQHLIYQSQYQQPNHVMDKRYNMPNMMTSPTPGSQHYGSTKPVPVPMLNNDMYVYAKPTPKENRKPNAASNNLRKTSFTSGERDTTDLSYESCNDDFINVPRQQNERNHQRSPTQFTKNQDGVGSFESWDYVFQNLNRSGYSKDLGERQDLLVQSLDLDALNINNDTSPSQTSSSAEKRRLNYAGNEIKPTTQQLPQQQQQQQPQSQVKQKTRTFERSTSSSSKNNTKMEILASASSSSALLNGKATQSQSMDNNKKIKSALKQTNATSKTNNPTTINSTLNKIHTKPTNDNKSSSTPANKSVMNNNNNNNSLVNPSSGNGLTKRKKSASSASAPQQVATRKSSGTTTVTPNNPPTSTQIIVTSPNEWSCKFCTFLNPNTKRICEMCCRTKDYNLDASTTNNTSTAGGSSTAVSHNTPTCV